MMPNPLFHSNVSRLSGSLLRQGPFESAQKCPWVSLGPNHQVVSGLSPWVACVHSDASRARPLFAGPRAPGRDARMSNHIADQVVLQVLTASVGHLFQLLFTVGTDAEVLFVEVNLTVAWFFAAQITDGRPVGDFFVHGATSARLRFPGVDVAAAITAFG